MTEPTFGNESFRNFMPVEDWTEEQPPLRICIFVSLIITDVVNKNLW